MNSVEWTQNSDPLNTTLPTLPNTNTLYRVSTLYTLTRQYSVYFNIEPITLNNSTQPTQTNNQNIQITPQQLVNLVRQFNSQYTQQTTNAPNPHYLQAASTQTLSPVVRRNTQMMYS